MKLFESVEKKVLRALIFKRAFITAFVNFCSCFFFFNISWIQTWELAKSALSWWRIIVSSHAIVWRTVEKRQSDWIFIVFIVSSDEIEIFSKFSISSTCHFSLLWRLRCFLIMIFISSFHAAFHNVTDDLTMSIKLFSSSVDLNETVSDRRVLSIWYMIDFIKFDFADESSRASISRRVKTLHALSLHSSKSENDLKTAFKNWVTSWWFDRLLSRKNDCHMTLHRHMKMICWTCLNLRNSEMSMCQIKVKSKMKVNLLNSWWTVSEFCIRMHINNFELIKKENRAAVNLQSWFILTASENILRIELWWCQRFVESSLHWKWINKWLLLYYESEWHVLVLNQLHLNEKLELYLLQLQIHFLIFSL